MSSALGCSPLSIEAAVESPRPKTRVITRTRRMLSCAECRLRRMKCDKAKPRCSRCIADGVASCVYVERRKSPLDSESTQVASKEIGAVKRRRQSETLSHYSPLRKLLDRETDVALAPGRQSIGYLSTSVGGRSKYVGATFWACVGTVDDNVDEILRSQEPQVRIQYDSSSADTRDRADIIRDRSELNGINGEAAAHHRSLLEDAKFKAIAATLNHPPNHPASLKELLEALPPRESCDLLCKEYFDAVHGIIPIIHSPSFQEQYNRLWLSLEGMSAERIRTGILAENPSFLSLLFAVLFAASTTCSEAFLKAHFSHARPQATSAALYQLTELTLSLVSFPSSPTLDSLSAFLISKNMVMREEDAMTTCSFIGTALRAAQGMGLHRDGSHFGLDKVKAEVRRHIWWHIIHTDVMTAIWCGLPAIWVDDGCDDTRMISNYVQVSRNTSFSAVENSDTQDDVRLIVAIGRYSVSSLLRKLLRRQATLSPFTMEDLSKWKQEIDSLKEQNELRIARLDKICSENESINVSAEETREGQHSSSAPGLSIPLYLDPVATSTFCSWGVLLLRLMVEKSYCMLYQPLVQGSSSVLPLQSLAEFIRHCHSFVETFLKMCINDSFRHYHWLYPGMYQALHPIAIILADLWNRPLSSEASTSRLLMDRVFSLLGPDGGVVTEAADWSTKHHLSTGGKKAWSVLYRMKRNAWIKAGLDPDVIWTAEPQQRQCDGNICRPQTAQHKPDVQLFTPVEIGRSQGISQNSVEPTSALPMTVPYPETLMPYDFAQTRGFSIPGYQSAEQAQNGGADPAQGLDAIEMENSLNEFAALMNGNAFDWHEWDFTGFGDNACNIDDSSV